MFEVLVQWYNFLLQTFFTHQKNDNIGMTGEPVSALCFNNAKVNAGNASMFFSTALIMLPKFTNADVVKDC